MKIKCIIIAQASSTNYNFDKENKKFDKENKKFDKENEQKSNVCKEIYPIYDTE